MAIDSLHLQRLAAYAANPQPGDPPRDPSNLGDYMDYGPFAQLVYGIQQGGDLQTLLPSLPPALALILAKADPSGNHQAQGDTWEHDSLLQATFPPIKWVVEGLVVSDGLTFLGGKKKVGKSLMALHLSWTVAAGGVFLGRKCEKGGVVYLCLEDGPRRLQGRLQKQAAPSGLPITYVTRFKPLDAGGLDDLRDLITDKQPSLLVLDTLAAAKTGKIDENAAGVMGDLINALRILAQDHHVGVLVVAHHGKISTGDAGFDLRGSSATPGASDVNLGIYRNEDGSTLKGEGRDIDAFALRVALDVPTLTWGLVGDARKIAKVETEDDVLGTLRKLGEADAGAIARETGKGRPWTARVLKRLEREGQVSSRTEKTGKNIRLLYKAVI